MSLIKSYVFSIQEMGFDPYHLNKEQSELNKELGEALKFLGDNLSQLVKYIRIKEDN